MKKLLLTFKVQICCQMPNLSYMTGLRGAVHKSLFSFDDVLFYQFEQEILDFVQVFLFITLLHIREKINPILISYGSEEFQHFGVKSILF